MEAGHLLRVQVGSVLVVMQDSAGLAAELRFVNPLTGRESWLDNSVREAEGGEVCISGQAESQARVKAGIP